MQLCLGSDLHICPSVISVPHCDGSLKKELSLFVYVTWHRTCMLAAQRFFWFCLFCISFQGVCHYYYSVEVICFAPQRYATVSPVKTMPCHNQRGVTTEASKGVKVSFQRVKVGNQHSNSIMMYDILTAWKLVHDFHIFAVRGFFCS